MKVLFARLNLLYKVPLLSALAVVLVLVTCKKDETEYDPTPYEIKAPKFFPTRMNIPADNPMTLEGVVIFFMTAECREVPSLVK